MQRLPADLVEPSTTDGQVLTTVAGEAAWADPVPRLVPLTTATGGVPEFVWDENDELVLTEVTL